MGVIHEHCKIPSCIDIFESPWNLGEIAEPGCDIADRNTNLGSSSCSCQRVEHIEVSSNGAPNSCTPPRKRAACGTHRHVSCITAAIGNHCNIAILGNFLSECVIAIDDGAAGVARREQTCFGGEIGIVGAMKVEMVVTKVGEGGGGELHSSHTLQGEGMRRHFHHDCLCPFTAFICQGALQLGCFWCGAGARERSEHGRALAMLGEDCAQHVGGGGLSVRAGNTDHR